MNPADVLHFAVAVLVAAWAIFIANLMIGLAVTEVKAMREEFRK